MQDNKLSDNKASRGEHQYSGSILNAKFLALLGILIVFIIGVGYFFYGLQPADDMTTAVEEFTVEQGEGFRKIGAKLSQKSIIRSIAVFKMYALLTGSAQKFKPGIYELSPDMSTPRIINLLVEGGKTEVQVTLPEGVTVGDIDRLLANVGVLPRNAIKNYDINLLRDDYSFLKNVNSLEGFLFPDTYRFNLESSAEEILTKLLDNFSEKAWPLIKNTNNWYDTLILASFLEREVKSMEDRRFVAGILQKRLESGVHLQVDATLSYIKCNRAYLGCEDAVVYNKDKEGSSPYNTYKRIGWTPTPISNPGEKSLKAAINPISSEYWYYLSALETGETIFARTLAEHNQNRAIYR